MSDHRYEPREIEAKWQAVWADERTWEVDNHPDPGRSGQVGTGQRASATRGANRDKSYVVEML
ncbi:MAG TPA: hypothetical protein VJQ45_05305, partial [Ktedonobacterales bacterium]|nr:hypothetical protein [Ktedonobacterales bacterium]